MEPDGNIYEITTELDFADRITILTHRRPDGDTVGSAIALCLGLRQLGKKATILENPQFTPRYRPFLEGLTAPEAEGLMVAVDVASADLLPLGFSGQVDLCIDHHPSNTHYAVVTYVDDNAAACGEIILSVLEELNVDMRGPIANAAYIAIATDTGCFRYSNTSPDTLFLTATLMEMGVPTAQLNHQLFECKTMARLRLEAYLAEHLTVYAGGKLGVCTLPQEVLTRLGATEDDADSIAGFARSLDGVEIGALLRDLPEGQCRISLRTDGRRYNAAELGYYLGGGGHRAAAGATVAGDLEEGRRLLLETVASHTDLTP